MKGHAKSEAGQGAAGKAPLRPVAKARASDGRPGDERLAVTLTLGELRAFLEQALLEALAETAAAGVAPALLDRNGIARALGVGTSTVDRLRREGMPCVLIGESPRFEQVPCIEWLRARGRS